MMKLLLATYKYPRPIFTKPCTYAPISTSNLYMKNRSTHFCWLRYFSRVDFEFYIKSMRVNDFQFVGTYYLLYILCMYATNYKFTCRDVNSKNTPILVSSSSENESKCVSRINGAMRPVIRVDYAAKLLESF